MSLRDKFRAAAVSRRVKPADLPDLGKIHLRSLSALEVACCENESEQGQFPEFVFAALMMVCDSEGRLEFACECSGSRLSYSEEDAKLIANLKPEVVLALVQEMRSVDPGSVEEELEDARKKSSPSQP